ncbi:MAG: acyltransferase [Deltaproteobacteria bacterium]|nr:acyltransferase [Deltaproteobacteria bacterium]
MRFSWIDFVKGVGIIYFIFWHCSSYFYEPGLYAYPPTRFIHYATGMFVFLAGLLVGLHYLPQMKNNGSARKIFIRLFIRGLKIIAMFFCGFLLKTFLTTRSLDLDGLVRILTSTASLFYIHRWDIPLQILFVIGLFLCASPLLLLVGHSKQHTKLAIVGVGIGIVEFFLPSRIPYLWHYFALGVFGAIAGFYLGNNQKWIHEKVGKYSGRIFAVVFLFTLPIQIATTLSQDVYHLFLYGLLPNLTSISLNIILLGLPILAILDLSTNKHPKLLAAISPLVLMGQSSLFVYILQISILTVISGAHLVTRGNSPTLPVFVSLAIAIVSLVSCYIVRELRKIPLFDKLYKAVFA